MLLQLIFKLILFVRMGLNHFSEMLNQPLKFSTWNASDEHGLCSVHQFQQLGLESIYMRKKFLDQLSSAILHR